MSELGFHMKLLITRELRWFLNRQLSFKHMLNKQEGPAVLTIRGNDYRLIMEVK